MVLPSLKSIKTLFGSPYRRAGSHPSRKHKEKKLPRRLEVGDGALLRDCSDSPGHKTDPNFDLVTGMPVNCVENVETSEIHVANRTQSKESPAKARIAPFNSTKDENWSNHLIMTNEKETAEEKMGDGDVKDFLEMKVKELDRVLTLEYKNALANEENSLSGVTLVNQLEEERSLRLEAERRLRDMSCENQVSKDRLTKLQHDFTRLEEMLCGLLQYKTRIDWLQKEKATQKMTYEMKICKYQNYVASLEKENLMLLTEVKSLENSSKQNDDRDRNLSRVLLERLRYLETENSSLVLETEQQRLQYERCLDDVANQVVQALLTQKSLREECLKLQKRVSDLEHHNRTLNLMFQRHIQLSSETSCQKDRGFSHHSTLHSSNHSSIATQTTSQSEDSLESLASLCSEYSIHSGHSGNGGNGCQGGNMMIGIPGLPKLSSPPMWIRKCLEPPSWPTPTLLPHPQPPPPTLDLPSVSLSNNLDLDLDIQCAPFFDDQIWSWDIDDLVTSEDDIYVTSAPSATIQRRPPSLLVELRNDQPPLNWLPTPQRPPTNRLILKRRPHSFNFASHRQVAAQLNVLCRSTLPREFKFSIVETGSEDKPQTETQSQNGVATRDEGYSTMSSDAQGPEVATQRGGTSEEDLQEEEEGAAEIFAADLDQSLILLQTVAPAGEDEAQHADEETMGNLFIVEDGDCDEFYIPIECALTVNVGRMQRAVSDSRLSGPDARQRPLVVLCASESCLELDKNAETRPFVALQRSKGKICLTDDDERGVGQPEVAETPEVERCEVDFSMDDVISAAFSNKWLETEVEEGFEGGGTSRASWGSAANGFLMLEYFRDVKCENGDVAIETESTGGADFCPDFYRLCQVDGSLGGQSEVYFKFGKGEESEESSTEEEEEAGGEGAEVAEDVCSIREKLEELNALMDENEDERRDDDEPMGKEGCTTSWVHVEADMDLTDPKARANLLDTMLGSSASSSSSECGDDAPDYQHLHQLHRHRRRHRKVTEHENCILRYIPPPRPSIIGRRDFFYRYGEQEQAAVASFDFLEELSTSVSDFGSAETLNADEQCRIEEDEMAEKQFEQEIVERISLSDSCAESFSSSNQSLNTLEE